MNYPNPRVNRVDRKKIIKKRVRALESKKLKIGDKRLKRLADYKQELSKI